MTPAETDEMTDLYDEAADRTVDSLCGMKGGCPVGTFYYKPDVPFLRSFNQLLETR